jgi:ATP-dependent Clp protease ATP-binding subunit ClpC
VDTIGRHAYVLVERARQTAPGRRVKSKYLIRRPRVLFKRNKLNVPPPRPPDLPFDDAARDALGGATAEAQKANSSAVHAEHLLLALLADAQGVPSRALARIGVDPEVVRRRIEHAAPPRPWGIRAPVLPYADDTKGAIEMAMREARIAGAREVGTGLLLLGVLQSPQGVPVRALAQLAISPATLRSALAVEAGLPRAPGTGGATDSADTAGSTDTTDATGSTGSTGSTDTTG